MKKLICTALVLAMCVAMTACGGDEAEKPAATECTHDYQIETTNEATCTEAGSRTYTCSVCGDSYSREIAMLGHSFADATCTAPKTCTICGETEGDVIEHDYKVRTTKNATCTKTGILTYTCSLCNDSYTEELGLLTHTYADATCTEPKTCKVCGETSGDTAEHQYTDATCTEPKTCKVCGKTSGDTAEHQYTDATCTEPKTCKVCGKTSGDTAEHQYTDATCTEPKTCTVCGKTSGDPKHDYTDATCIEPKTCKVCGETSGDVAEHQYTDATCTEPKTCKICEATDGEALGHDFVEDSATDGHNLGSTVTYHCSICKTTKEEKIKELSLTAYRSSEINFNGWLASVSYTATASGGYGDYSYKFEVYSTEYSSTPSLTEDFSSNADFGWSSRLYCNGNVLMITAKDEMGNTATIKVVVDSEDTIEEIPSA